MGRLAAENHIHRQMGQRWIQQRFERPTGEIVWIHASEKHQHPAQLRAHWHQRMELSVFRPQQGVMRTQQLAAMARHEPLVALVGEPHRRNSDPAADQPGEADRPGRRSPAAWGCPCRRPAHSAAALPSWHQDRSDPPPTNLRCRRQRKQCRQAVVSVVVLTAAEPSSIQFSTLQPLAQTRAAQAGPTPGTPAPAG